MIDSDQALESAIAEHRQGNVAAAVGIYARILESDPDHAGARHMMGVVRLQEGRPADAETEFRRAIARVGGIARYHYNLGVALSAQERLGEALNSFESALALDPQFFDAAFGKGTALLRLGRSREAEEVLRPWVAVRPDDAALIANLVAALGRQDKIAECVEFCRAGLDRRLDDPVLHVNLAVALERLDDLAGAEAAARAAVARDPNGVMSRVVRARVLRRQGVPAASRDILQPMMGALSQDADIVEVADELGLAFLAMGAAREAFGAFSRRNSARARTEEAQLFDGGRGFERIREGRAWTRDRLAKLVDRAPQRAGEGFVFLAGFLDAGADVIGRALASRVDVAIDGTGRALAAVRRHIRSLDAEASGYPRCLEDFSDGMLDDLRQVYQTEVERQVGRSDGKVVVDCGPMNLTDLGLIDALFPSSRVIVPVRDPRDVCLSCFHRRVALTDATVNFLRPETTAQFHAEAIGLWLDLRGFLTVPSLEVRYERLEADPTGVLREVFDFIGLPGDDGLANFGALPGPVSWRSCADDLASIQVILGPSVEALGYGD